MLEAMADVHAHYWDVVRQAWFFGLVSRDEAYVADLYEALELEEVLRQGLELVKATHAAGYAEVMRRVYGG